MSAQEDQDRCLGIAGLTMIPDHPKVEIRCDLYPDHLQEHAIVHDDVVLLVWGIDDDGIGVVTGGVFGSLFPGANET